jgi:hypothetical protein
MLFGFMGVIYMVWLYLTWLPAYLEHERHLSIARTGWVVVIPTSSARSACSPRATSPMA